MNRKLKFLAAALIAAYGSGAMGAVFTYGGRKYDFGCLGKDSAVVRQCIKPGKDQMYVKLDGKEVLVNIDCLAANRPSCEITAEDDKKEKECVKKCVDEAKQPARQATIYCRSQCIIHKE
jgi:hypothetical protein